MSDEIWRVVRSIPRGRVAGYGDVGRVLAPRLSGLLVGRRLRSVPDDVPWWRVVAADGSLPTAKRDPRLARDQRERLEAEGVSFDETERIDMARYRWEPV